MSPIRHLLGIEMLNLNQWGVIFGVAFSLLAVVEIGKLISNHRHSFVASSATEKSL